MWIEGRYFERKCFWLRKVVPQLDRAYAAAHGVGRAFFDASLRPGAQKAVDEISLATQSEMKNGVPKKIWMYWNTSLEDSPDVVKLSVESWRKMNPDYDVCLLNDDNIEKELGFDFFSAFDLCRIRLTMAMKADVLRLYLLSKYGGIWVDATVFCFEPLDDWLLEDMGNFDFFTFRHEGEPSRPVEAWFIASIKGCEVIQFVLSLFLEHLFCTREKTLYVSNSRKDKRKVNMSKRKTKPIGASVVREAEWYGFVPYFTVGYFFNEAIAKSMSSESAAAFLGLPNRNFKNGKGDFFIGTVVSKESYKKGHQESRGYIGRREYLSTRIGELG